MKFIVISNPTNIPDEHNLLCSMFDMGLTLFHLRKPNFSYQELKDYIQLIPEQHKDKVVLHAHHSLAVEYGLKGIHFTKTTPFDANKTYKKTLQLSTSFHTLEELKNATQNFEYVFISPVFDSISKDGYKSSFDFGELKNLMANRTKNIKVIALGGVNAKNINTAIELGFDGIGVLGAIWNTAYPLKHFANISKSLEYEF